MTVSTYQRMNIYLPEALARSLHTEAGMLGKLRYSRFIAFKIADGISILKTVSAYTELKRKKRYKAIIEAFIPSRPGRRWDDSSPLKKMVTFYFSKETISDIRRQGKRLGLSNSSVVELALLIANEGVSPTNIEFQESDIRILRETMAETGALTMTDFLTACQGKDSIRAIRKWIKYSRDVG